MPIKDIARELNHLCRKAGVAGEPRLSISFATAQDAYRFEREVHQELAALSLSGVGAVDINATEFTLYGVKIRLVADA
jgi:hypothetical protein